MRQKLPYILLFLVSVATYGQVSLDLITDRKEYTTKDLIELTVILEINGEEYNQESPIRLPDFSHFYERGTGSTKNSLLSPDSHTMVSQLVYQMILQPKQAGTFKIGSALVKVNGKIYKTEPFDITISDKPSTSLAKNHSNDIYLNMEIENREVYVNEPVIAVLKAYAKDFNNFRKIKNITPPQQKNLQVYPVETNRAEIEMNRRGQMASQTLAVYMFFPEKSGRMDISPSVIEVKNANQNHTEKLKSNTLQINVKQLPDEIPTNFANAVGTYNLKLETLEKASKFEIDKPINLIIKVNGKGNLDKHIIPKIKKSDAYQFFPPQIKQNIRNTENGLEGEITAHYIIIPKKIGEIAVATSGFSFFDPNDEQYVDLGEKSLQFQIIPQEEKSALEKVNEYTQNVEIPILKSTPKGKKDNINIINILSDYTIGGLAVLGIILGAFVFLRRKKETPSQSEHCHENIEDIEKKLKSQRFGNELYLFEIQALFENKEYSKYLDFLEKKIFVIWEEKFGKNLERIENEQISQRYIHLANMVRNERFCPIHTEENMKKIQQEVESIFCEIS